MSCAEVTQFTVKGLLTPTVNPYKPNGDLDLEKIPAYIDHMLEYGVPNIFITGTMGEGMNLTMAERKSVAEAWVKYGKGRLSCIIAHIGCGNLRDSQELARHAQDIGIDAIACVGPTYFKPQTLDDYVEYMRQVAAAAPTLPFFLYDIDFITGIKFRGCDFMNAAKDKIPTLRGLKHTSPDTVSMQSIIQDHGDRFLVFMGTDEMYLEGLSIGVDSTIMTSCFGKIMQRLEAAFEKGDLKTARIEQMRIVKICEIRTKYGLVGAAATKATLKALFGLDLGQPRCPLTPFSEDDIPKLREDCMKAGFSEWGMK